MALNSNFDVVFIVTVQQTMITWLEVWDELWYWVAYKVCKFNLFSIKRNQLPKCCIFCTASNKSSYLLLSVWNDKKKKKSAASDFNKNTLILLCDTGKLLYCQLQSHELGLQELFFIILWVALATDKESYSVREKFLSGWWLQDISTPSRLKVLIMSAPGLVPSSLMKQLVVLVPSNMW
jgi:hypothetical protein